MSQTASSTAPNIQTARDGQGNPFAKVFSWPDSKQVLSIHRDNGNAGAQQEPSLVITTLLDGYMLASTRMSFRKDESSTPELLGSAELTARREVYFNMTGAFLDRFGADDAQTYVDLLASTLKQHAPGLQQLRAVRELMESFGLSKTPARFVRIISDAGKDILVVAQNEDIPGAKSSEESLACLDIIHGSVQKRYTCASRADRDVVIEKDLMLKTMGASVLALAAAASPPTLGSSERVAAEPISEISSITAPLAPSPRMKH